MGSSDERIDFRQCWDRDGPRVAAYARRHVAADDVHDLVAETFLQAWRRWDAVPDPPIAWLIGTARKLIGNHRRAQKRRGALQDRLIRVAAAARSADDVGMLAIERADALDALTSLPDEQREALLLRTWDGLSAEQAAAVLGIRPGTLRVHTHRARAALARRVTASDNPMAIATICEGGPR